MIAVDSRDVFLRLQYWWVNHKLELRHWWVLSILVFDALALIVVVVMVISAAIGSGQLSGRVKDQVVLLGTPLTVAARPVAIQVEGSWGIRSDDGSSDFIAKLTNPNDEWFASSLSVSFSVGATEITESVSTFLLPGETRHVFLHQSGALPPNVAVRAEVGEVQWEHPASLFPVENTAFSVANESLIPLAIITGQTGDATRATAEVTNNSIYGFWVVPVNVLVLREDEPVAISEQTLREIKPFEKQIVTAQWVQRVSSGVTVLVEPYVNPFDENNHLPVR